MIDEKKLAIYFKELEKNTKTGVWDLDIVNNLLYWSDYVFSLFEVDPDEFQPHVEFFLSAIHPDDRTMVQHAYETSLTRKHPYDVVHRIQLSGDRIKFVRERCRTIFDAEGNPLHSIGTVQDVTDDILKQQELQESEKTILELSHMAVLGELASGIAHEVNNPLSILRGYHQMRTEWMTGCPQCAYKDKIIKYSEKELVAIERISTVISSLKSFSYVQSNAENQLERFDIDGEVKASVDFIKTIYEHNHIRVQFSSNVSAILIEGNTAIFQQVLMNLYSNARDALKGIPDACLEITLNEEDGKVVLKVKDNGEGISDEVLPRIFDHRFTTKPKGVGTGYGLSFVKKSINNMNGHIKVSSKKNEGTTFFLSFPIIEKQKITCVSENDPSDVACADTDTTLNCLVVDDEPEIAEYLCYILEDLGHDADLVLSGAEALKRVEEKQYDCIFTDIVMPEMNGQKLLRLLTQKKFPGKKVIVSGNFYPQGKSISMSYDAHVEKPYSIEDIKQVLNTLFYSV